MRFIWDLHILSFTWWLSASRQVVKGLGALHVGLSR